MIGVIWFMLLLVSIVTGLINGTFSEVMLSVTNSAQAAFSLILGLGGIMAFWLGLMRIAEDSGLIQDLGRITQPVLKNIFEDIPPDHPVLGTISLNIAANMLGLGNAATPIGIKVMEQLETLNPQPKSASNDMCLFLAINTSSVQLIPTTAIMLLASAGSAEPTVFIVSSLLATSVSTIVAIITAKILSRYPS